MPEYCTPIRSQPLQAVLLRSKGLSLASGLNIFVSTYKTTSDMNICYSESKNSGKFMQAKGSREVKIMIKELPDPEAI